MNTIFKKEWELYRQDWNCQSFRGVAPKPCKKGFDEPVGVGEIRIFADMNRPFVALVLADEGPFGYRIVPVSPFTVPASAREMLIGERVYQLWNDCRAARSFVARSWVVDSLDDADLDEITSALSGIPVGTVSQDKVVAAYERVFRVSGGTFRFLQAKDESRAWWLNRKVLGLVAMLTIFCGGLACFLNEAPRDPADDRQPFQIEIARSPVPAEDLASVPEPEDEMECATMPEIDVEIDSPSCRAPAPQRLATCSAGAPQAPSVTIEGDPFMMRRARSGAQHISNLTGSGNPGSYPSPVRPLDALRERTGETYAEARENEFQDPTQNPLSTFGLDVDTTSYALMRSSLSVFKRLPPRESVRIEEFVNYFKYDLPQPKGTDPIAVDCEFAACPWNERHRLLRIGVQAKKVDDAKLPPCNLTFLVDVSGSMDGEYRLGLLQNALRMLVGKLRSQDHVAIVTYANDARVALASVSGREKRRITAVIDGLRAYGCTAGGAGLRLAYDEARKNFDKKANNRVILVTDGDFNVGMSTPKELEAFIAKKRKSGVFLTVFGVGRGNFMDANMKKLANAGNGNYAFLDSLLEAKKVMLNEFAGTMATVAKDVKIQVEFNPAEVERYRLLGYENRRLAARDFNDDRKDAGEIGAGHAMTAFYEVVPAGTSDVEVDPLKYQAKAKKPARPAGVSDELCTVKLRWKAPNGTDSNRRELPVKAAAVTRSEPSGDFRFASAVVEFALLLSDSKHKGDASFTDALERARNAKGDDREGYRAEFIRLVEQAELLDRLAHPPSEPEVDVEI